MGEICGGGGQVREDLVLHQVENRLKNHNSLVVSITNLQSELEALEATEADELEPGAIDYSKDKVQTSGVGSTYENQVIRKVDKIEAIKRKIAQTQRKVDEVERALKVLNEAEREIVELKCIQCLPYFQFTYKIHRSERSAKYIKKEAIRKLAVALYGEREKGL